MWTITSSQDLTSYTVETNMTYNFRTINNHVTIVTEYNTRILWLSPDGRVLVGRTLRSRFKYWWHQKTAPVRYYVQLKKMATKSRHVA